MDYKGANRRGRGGYPLVKRRRRRRTRFFRSAALLLAVLLCGTGFVLLLMKGPSLMEAIASKPPQSDGSQKDAAVSNEEEREVESQSQPESVPSSDALPESESEASVWGYPAEKKEDSSSVEETVDDSYFDDAAFVGDSRTQGLMLYTGLGNATFYTAQGLMVDTFFTKKVIGSGENKLTIPDAMKQQTFGKVYIMLGVNELGWSYEDVFIQKYGELVDEVKKLQPEATVFIQSILPVSKAKSDRDKVYNNAKINRYNELIKEMAEKKGAVYLNVAEAVGLDNGALPEEASTDGVHLNKEYCLKWLDYLKSHASQ